MGVSKGQKVYGLHSDFKLVWPHVILSALVIVLVYVSADKSKIRCVVVHYLEEMCLFSVLLSREVDQNWVISNLLISFFKGV